MIASKIDDGCNSDVLGQKASDVLQIACSTRKPRTNNSKRG